MGATASTEQQAIAATAFTALVDALWISLVALRPGNVLPGANLVLGLLGLTSTVGLAVRLWRARAQQKLSRRWPYLLLFIIVVYVGRPWSRSRRAAPRPPSRPRAPWSSCSSRWASRGPGNCSACAGAA
jgi:hypothetical protein